MIDSMSEKFNKISQDADAGAIAATKPALTSTQL